MKTLKIGDKLPHFECVNENEEIIDSNQFIGKKYGGYLLSEALKLGFRKNTKKVWLHTCSLDHKHDLKNYLGRGMKIFKKETISI